MVFAVDKALKHRVILLAGEEDVVRRRALSALNDALGEDAAMESSVFEGGASSVMDWVGAAMTAPFLAGRRLVIVRRVLRQKPEPLSVELPETGLLVLVADDEPGDDDKRSKFVKAKAEWEKAVEAAKGFVVKSVSDPKEIKGLLKDDVATIGKRISSNAIDLLVEMTGGSYSRASEEIQKAAIYVGDEEAITESHLRQVVMPSPEWNVFRLVDAILAGRQRDALRMLRTLLSSASKPEDPTFKRVFPEIARQLRLTWQARICVEAGVQPPNVPQELTALFPAKPNIMSLQPFMIRQSLQLARRVGFPQIAACFGVLSDAEAEIKGLLPNYGVRDTLERMVLRMAEATAPAAALRR